MRWSRGVLNDVRADRRSWAQAARPHEAAGFTAERFLVRPRAKETSSAVGVKIEIRSLGHFEVARSDPPPRPISEPMSWQTSRKSKLAHDPGRPSCPILIGRGRGAEKATVKSRRAAVATVDAAVKKNVLLEPWRHFKERPARWNAVKRQKE